MASSIGPFAVSVNVTTTASCAPLPFVRQVEVVATALSRFRTGGAVVEVVDDVELVVGIVPVVDVVVVAVVVVTLVEVVVVSLVELDVELLVLLDELVDVL